MLVTGCSSAPFRAPPRRSLLTPEPDPAHVRNRSERLPIRSRRRTIAGELPPGRSDLTACARSRRQAVRQRNHRVQIRAGVEEHETNAARLQPELRHLRDDLPVLPLERRAPRPRQRLRKRSLADVGDRRRFRRQTHRATATVAERLQPPQCTAAACGARRRGIPTCSRRCDRRGPDDKQGDESYAFHGRAVVLAPGSYACAGRKVYPASARGRGGIGRRAGFRSRWSLGSLEVQVLSPASPMEIRLRFRGDMMISIGFLSQRRAAAANGGEAAIRGGITGRPGPRFSLRLG